MLETRKVRTDHSHIPPNLKTAQEAFANGDSKDRGAIFTKRPVVDFMLDLIGYSFANDIATKRIIEPSFGDGDFLLPIIERIIFNYKTNHSNLDSIHIDLKNSILGFELHAATCEATKKKTRSLLGKLGCSEEQASTLTETWLQCGDFLLSEIDGRYDNVVGNPPYIRQESIPNPILDEYRKQYFTMYDRADIYVAFYQRSLSLLSNGGGLAFICADRWTKNKYGGPLRGMISKDFWLKYYIDMTDAEAFHSDVSPYPAITVIQKSSGNKTRIAHCSTSAAESLSHLYTSLTGTSQTSKNCVTEVVDVVNKTSPWLVHSLDQVALVRRLENEFPTMESAGCKVGIGVATGADKVYLGPYDELPVEDSRKLPILKTTDIKTGRIKWHGTGVVNPFENDGSVVDLSQYPLLEQYLINHAELIQKRAVAKKNPTRWFRTIDKITSGLTKCPKLLIPDIKGEANIVYDKGEFYPHHNLYFITSDMWDLRALQGLLLSGIAKLFVSMYTTKMRGGYLRFQAQYLRRIRIPFWIDVPDHLRNRLIKAAIENDVSEAADACCEIYRMDQSERLSIGC